MKTFYVKGEQDDTQWLGEAIYYKDPLMLIGENVAAYLEGKHLENGVERIAGVVGRLCELLVEREIISRQELLNVFDIETIDC